MNFSGSDLEGFRKTVSRIFNKHAPIKRNTFAQVKLHL